MTPAEIPHDDATRLLALQASNVLGSGPQCEFDGLVRAAAVVCNAPIALLNLVDGHRVLIKAMQASHRAAIELAEQHELLRVTLHAIEDAVMTTNPLGEIAWLNPEAERLTGWPAVDAMGRASCDVFDAIASPSRLPIDELTVGRLGAAREKTAAAPAILISRTGTEHGIEYSVTPILGKNGAATGAVIVFRDVTERRRLSDEITFRSTHDSLTGLPNRVELDERLQAAWASARTQAATHVLLHVDLDHFKLVNDACGHAAGDQLLQQVAAMLREAVRETDLVARIGGDEFAVLLENCPTSAARRMAQGLCDRMETFRFIHAEHRIRVGTSIGLVAIDARWTDSESVMQAAEDCCHAAKVGGCNRVRMWFDTDASLHARTGDAHCAEQIEQALDEDRFALFAQRIEPLGPHLGGLHAEVLLRMVEPDGTIVAPGLFLPAAERYQMATRIDRWVLRRTIAWMSGVLEPCAIERISVNLSGQSVSDRDFHLWAMALLADSGEQICHRLCLEITETAAVTHIVDAASFVDQVRSLGVKVALDDFGAGASSFGYLKTLAVDCLKIDGQFIRGLPDDPLDAAAVRCFVDVARVMGIETVAEFVDRPAVLDCIRELGVDLAQGFLLHRPMPIDELIEPVDEPGEDEPGRPPSSTELTAVAYGQAIDRLSCNLAESAR
jgi:diguanylate cyclase (GGDEF)-like protein/PAS domain S-box-containing protein